MREMQGEHFQKFNRLNRKFRKRVKRNHHHLTNSCKGGKTTPNNLLLIKIERHASLHRFFRNMSWEEIGDALYSIFGLRDPVKCYEVVQRISRLKGRVA